MQKDVICLSQGRYIFLPFKLMFVSQCTRHSQESLSKSLYHTISKWVISDCLGLIDVCSFTKLFYDLAFKFGTFINAELIWQTIMDENV